MMKSLEFWGTLQLIAALIYLVFVFFRRNTFLGVIIRLISAFTVVVCCTFRIVSLIQIGEAYDSTAIILMLYIVALGMAGYDLCNI